MFNPHILKENVMKQSTVLDGLPEHWPDASYEAGEEVFVKCGEDTYVGGRCLSVGHTLRGETVYTIKLASSIITRLKAGLAK